MFKSFAARAIIPAAMAVTGFVIVCCLLLYSVMKQDMHRDAVQHAKNLSDTIVKSTRYAMLKSDRETLGNIVDNVGELQGVEHARIFNKKGLVMFSNRHEELNHLVDKKGAGCINCHAGPEPVTTLGTMEQARLFTNDEGKKVLAITAPIYNEPACYTAACHVHTAGQKVLGTLDVGLSREPLENTLNVMGKRMISFSFMILLLTVGGVSALLRRNVFIPLRQLSNYTEELSKGNIDSTPPECGDELKKLATSFHDMADRIVKLESDSKRPENSSPSQEGKNLYNRPNNSQNPGG